MLSTCKPLHFPLQMSSCSCSHQMSIVHRRWNGNSTSTTAIRVTQVVGNGLKLVSSELGIIIENMVTRRARGTLKNNINYYITFYI